MVLRAEVMSVSTEANKNIIRVNVPGETRARVVRFDATMFQTDEDGKPLIKNPKVGDFFDCRVELIPSERLEVKAIAPNETMGAYSVTVPRESTLEEVEAVAPELLPHGLRYVAKDPQYIAPAALKAYGNTFERLSRAGHSVKGQLIGPAGCGKTSFAYDFAAEHRRPFIKIDMGTKISPEELLGFREFRDGQTHYVSSMLVEALATPRACILLDEINRISPSNAGPLFPLLDHTGEVWSDYLQRHIVVHPSVVIFGTSNLGASFTGTYIMDEALESRFQYPIEIEFPPLREEAQIISRRTGVPDQIARNLCEFAIQIRSMADPALNDALERTISTRTLIAVGHLIQQGMPPAEALRLSVLPRYSNDGGSDAPRQKVAVVLQGKFGK